MGIFEQEVGWGVFSDQHLQVVKEGLSRRRGLAALSHSRSLSPQGALDLGGPRYSGGKRREGRAFVPLHQLAFGCSLLLRMGE